MNRGRERAWWLLASAMAAAVLVAVIARIGGEPWVQLAFIAVGTGLGLLVVELRARRAQVDKGAAVVREYVADGSEQLRRVSDVGIREAGVRRAIEEVDYVQPDVEPEVKRRLRTEKRVLIVGPSRSGKTRLALQVTKHLYANLLFLPPKDGRALHGLLAAGLTGTRLVVWLDDLDRYLGSDGLTAEVLDRFHEQGHVLVATIRSAAYKDLLSVNELPDWLSNPVELPPWGGEPKEQEQQELIEDLIDEILGSSDGFAERLRDAGVTKDALLSEVRKSEIAIANNLTKERQSLFIAKAQLQEALGQVTRRRSHHVPFLGRSLVATAVMSSLIAAMLFALPLFPFVPAFVARVRWLLTVGLVAIAVIVLITQALLARIERNSSRRVDAQEERLGVEALTSRVDSARLTYRQAWEERVLRPIASRLLSERSPPTYTTELRFVDCRGLSAVHDPDIYEVETAAVKDIRVFLDHTPGGSIGLAGSRGTGKSTVMDSFVEGRSRKSDQALITHAVKVTAPVEYAPREFILHVFAQLCEAVIVPHPPGVPLEPPSATYAEYAGAAYRRVITAAIGGALSLYGVLLVLTSAIRFNIDWRRYGGLSLMATGIALVLATRYLARRAEETKPPWVQLPRERVSPQTAQMASGLLDVIRFQQTYTGGWSGSAKVAVGVAEGTAGVTRGTSHMRNALSLPQIADYFKQFVLHLTKVEGALVLIAVDELDKIEPAERAHAFLNDLRSITGVPQSYFLIGISEDALGGFERRGLPIRDAYDSALDEVVRFLPIEYTIAKTLLRNRVVGLPAPYVGLALCLAGGIPRDVIRWARAIATMGGNCGKGLSSVCRALLEDDLRRKFSASMTAVAAEEAPASTDGVLILNSLSTCPEAKSLLRECHTHLSIKDKLWSLRHRSQAGTAGMTAERARDERNDARAAVLRVEGTILELLSYFYFAATVLAVFTDDLTEADFTKLSTGEEPVLLTQLAQARHAFSVDPSLGMQKVSHFRLAYGLDPLEDLGDSAPSVGNDIEETRRDSV